jgi:hypothetical protein
MACRSKPPKMTSDWFRRGFTTVWMVVLLIGYAIGDDWVGFFVTFGCSPILIVPSSLDAPMQAFEWPGIWRFMRLQIELTVGFGLLVGGTFALLGSMDFEPLFALELGVLFATGVSLIYICGIVLTRLGKTSRSKRML